MTRLVDLKTQVRNANKHTPRGLGALRKSIGAYGLADGITVAADGESLSGSARLETLADLMPDVKIVEVETDGNTLLVNRRMDIANADDPRGQSLSAAVNIVQRADYDPDGELLAALAANDADLAEMVRLDDLSVAAMAEFTADEPQDADPQIDRAAELQVKWDTHTGDLWLIGEHRLLCGDSTQHADVERVMQGDKADTVIADPPYGIDLDTDYSKMPSTKPEGNKSYALIVNDDKPFDYGTIAHIGCKEAFWFGADYYAKTLPAGGSWLVWDKRVDDSFDAMFGSAFETVWSKVKHKREIIRCNNTLFSGESEARGKLHPTMKPTKVIKWIAEKYSAMGESILDYFAGSGTTLVACENLHRRCRAIEISPAYVAVCLQRMSDAFPNLRIERAA